jgi:hypothetical protein
LTAAGVGVLAQRCFAFDQLVAAHAAALVNVLHETVGTLPLIRTDDGEEDELCADGEPRSAGTA